MLSPHSNKLHQLSPECCCLLTVDANGKGRGSHQGLRPVDAEGVWGSHFLIQVLCLGEYVWAQDGWCGGSRHTAGAVLTFRREQHAGAMCCVQGKGNIQGANRRGLGLSPGRGGRPCRPNSKGWSSQNVALKSSVRGEANRKDYLRRQTLRLEGGLGFLAEPWCNHLTASLLHTPDPEPLGAPMNRAGPGRSY